ncbi:MAG: hypothetical protein JSV33_01745 [bacterium]|nr:MAG: hypothetical protein JSV33_01745 [bacterium]
MKRVLLTVVLAVSILVCAGGLRADERLSRIDPRDFELGILLGEPTGLSAKLWTTWNMAIDFGAAWSFQDDGHFHIHADYLFHNFDLIEVDSGSLPVYFGIGGRVRLQDEDSRAGIRIAVGLEYILQNHPASVFLEIAPIVDIAPETEVDVNGGLGVRYIF